MHKVISNEVAFYKLNLNETEITLYGESSKKVYNNPVRLFALINKEEMTTTDEDIGLNTTQNVTFSFLRDDLKDWQVVPHTGDIIKFDQNYYEIDNVTQQQYFFGRNPDTLLLTTEGRSNMEFGYNQTVKCSCHLTKRSPLQIEEIRSGIEQKLNIPRNL